MIKMSFIFVIGLIFLIPFGCSITSKKSQNISTKMPAIFCDNMVLQRDMNIPVWGWSKPGAAISVSLGDIKKETKTDSLGNWMIKFPALEAGGPLILSIKGYDKEIVFKNVMIGDVWICGGQSNMEFTLSKSADGESEVQKADYPNIRLFMVEKKIATSPQTDTNGKWEVCSPATVKDFSGVGYFFGREIYNNIKVPVGLLKISWGGTPIESWMSKSSLESDPDFLPIYSAWEEKIKKYPEAKKAYDIKLKEWEKAKQDAAKAGKTPPEMPVAPYGPSSPRQPNVLFNGLVNPVIPFAFKGVIWYQGESNFPRGYQYRKLFPVMIKDWRTHSGQGDFPFIFVQLPNYRSSYQKKGAWSEVREAQLMTLKSVPNTAMAVTIDIGDPDDLHPKNKLDVGKRLALCALKLAYKKDVVASGPLYKGMSVIGNKIKIDFDNIEGGLISKNNEPLKGFVIAGEDKNFVPAEAIIEGDSVIVSDKTISNPAAVRYGWESAPEVNLYNKSNLPASPFRTDSWQGESEGNNAP